MDKIIKAWNTHWHRTVDPELLGRVRALFYFLILIYFAILGRRFFQVESLAYMDEVIWRPVGLFKYLPYIHLNYNVLYFLKMAWFLSLFLSAIGLVTRVATFLSFILGFYLLGMMGNYGQEALRDGLLMICLGAWAAVPCGMRFSLDARLFASRLRPFSLWPIWLAVDYLLICYFIAFLQKMIRTQFDYFTTDFIRNVVLLHQGPIAPWLAGYPILCRFLGLATLVIEATAIIALIYPRRTLWVMGSLLTLHLGIELAMSMHFYQNCICLALLLLVPRAGSLSLVPQLPVRIVHGVFIALFAFFAIWEARFLPYNWPFLHMAYYTFRSDGDRIHNDVLRVWDQKGRNYVIDDDRLTEPFDRHHAFTSRRDMWNAKDMKRLERSLYFWRDVIEKNMNLPKGSLAGISHENQILEVMHSRPPQLKLVGTEELMRVEGYLVLNAELVIPEQATNISGTDHVVEFQLGEHSMRLRRTLKNADISLYRNYTALQIENAYGYQAAPYPGAVTRQIGCGGLPVFAPDKIAGDHVTFEGHSVQMSKRFSLEPCVSHQSRAGKYGFIYCSQFPKRVFEIHYLGAGDAEFMKFLSKLRCL